MLETVVVDAEALARLDVMFARCGIKLPRSLIVDRRFGLDWHAIPIDAGSITAIQQLKANPIDSFNDCLRRMLDLAPLESAVSLPPIAAPMRPPKAA